MSHDLTTVPVFRMDGTGLCTFTVDDDFLNKASECTFILRVVSTVSVFGFLYLL